MAILIMSILGLVATSPRPLPRFSAQDTIGPGLHANIDKFSYLADYHDLLDDALHILKHESATDKYMPPLRICGPGRSAEYRKRCIKLLSPRRLLGSKITTGINQCRIECDASAPDVAGTQNEESVKEGRLPCILQYSGLLVLDQLVDATWSRFCQHDFIFTGAMSVRSLKHRP
jgi:hypothetical protein